AADFRNAQLRAEKIVILNMPVMRICVYMCVSAVMWSGGIMAIYGGIQVGKLVSLITYVIRVLTSLMMLSMVFVGFILSRASIERIVEVLDEEPSIKSKDGIAECRGIQEQSAVADAPAVDLQPRQNSQARQAVQTSQGECGVGYLQTPPEKAIDGKIEFDDVYFSYSSGKNARYSIKGVSLNIPSGQFTGIIGGTGCGKSTLIQLIPRLYDVTSGSIKVSGINVKDYDLKALRDKVSVVLQKNVLFSGTIRENLKWGNPSASDKELEEACRAADAHNFIMSLPQGYDTVLEQGGVNLSGGQRQRICIARALLKKPAILILDDSTSAVDTATEKRIRTALRSYLPDSTIIVIAQRITSVQNADCIYVLDNGKISASGTHETLLKTSSVYQEVYESQQYGSGDADIVEEN
nr:ABC transporter ATP-binding protein/permease [Treponema sp.]